MSKPATQDITRTDLYKKLCYILSEEILGNTDPVEHVIDPDADMVNELGLDDLDNIEYVMLVEDEFGMSIDDDVAATFRTIRNVYDYLISKNVPENYTSK